MSVTHPTGIGNTCWAVTAHRTFPMSLQRTRFNEVPRVGDDYTHRFIPQTDQLGD